MKHLRTLYLAVLLLCALLAPPASHALASYSAQATSLLTVTGFADGSGTAIPKPVDLIVEGDAFVFDEFEAATPGATASAAAVAQLLAVDPFDLMLGEGPSQDALVSGSAVYTSDASSQAVARTDGLVFVDNASTTETYRVDFGLSVSWLVDASVSAPHEIARSEISLLLAALSGGVLFELIEFADTATGDGPDAASSLFFGSLTLGPGEFDELTMRTDAIGAARAVPEPSTALLIGLGLAWVGVRRRTTGR
jgi:hypothetical protein